MREVESNFTHKVAQDWYCSVAVCRVVQRVRLLLVTIDIRLIVIEIY